MVDGIVKLDLKERCSSIRSIVDKGYRVCDTEPGPHLEKKNSSYRPILYLTLKAHLRSFKTTEPSDLPI